MDEYILYNSDIPAAEFTVDGNIITRYRPTAPELLPMQIRSPLPDRFMLWLRDRSIDLNTLVHRNLIHELLATRDKLTLSLLTHMFSISDTFTCFPKDEFIPRKDICSPDDQNFVSKYILVSSDTSLRNARIATPNASTDGSFPKTWVFENDSWWLYKLQSVSATRSEVEISKALLRCGWDAAEYRYVSSKRTQVKTRSFLGENEFFEPYDSFRYSFSDLSDDDAVIYDNIASLGVEYELAWKRILLADAFFMNTDRHMRNFGVIRSAKTGKLLRLAPNFDNNQAYLANPSGKHSDAMLKMHMRNADSQTYSDLRTLLTASQSARYLSQAVDAAQKYL